MSTVQVGVKEALPARVGDRQRVLWDVECAGKGCLFVNLSFISPKGGSSTLLLALLLFSVHSFDPEAAGDPQLSLASFSPSCTYPSTFLRLPPSFSPKMLSRSLALVALLAASSADAFWRL